jgi:hypothetical protein
MTLWVSHKNLHYSYFTTSSWKYQISILLYLDWFSLLAIYRLHLTSLETLV